MSSKGWRIERLQNLCSHITDGKHGDCRNQAYSGFYFLSAKDVFDGKLSYENARQITKEDFQDTHKRTRLEPFDILLTNSGTIGRMAIAPDHDLTSRTTFQKSVALLKPIREKVIPGFLFYCLTARKSDIENTASGTTQKNLLLGDLRQFEIRIPESMETQRSIADILSALDEKIELNRQTNETLEAIAQAIFKEWFIDFNFPGATGEMVESELGMIPKGWRVGRLGDFGKVVCGKTPSKSSSNFFGGEVKFIKIPDMHNSVFIVETEDSLTMAGAETQINKFLPSYSVIVSCIATLGLVSLTSDQCQTNQQINAIVPSKNYISFYLYFIAKNLYGILNDLGSAGSATLNVNTSSFSNINCIIPSDDTLKEFDNVVKPLFSKLLLLMQESLTITSIRDKLLPKLMSGEIEV